MTGGATIDVAVNGEKHRIEPGSTLEALVDVLGMDRRGLAIAVDEEVVPRSAWTTHPLAEGSRVEILTIAQGG